MKYNERNSYRKINYTKCDSLNLKSRKLLEKLKMRKEGELKKHLYFKRDISGEPLWADTCLYGILRDEWQ